MGGAGRADEGQGEGQQHQGSLRPQQNVTSLEPVGHGARHQPEEGEREQLREAHEPHPEGRVGQAEHEEPEGQVLHPRPGVGDGGANDEDAEVAVGQRGEGARRAQQLRTDVLRFGEMGAMVDRRALVVEAGGGAAQRVAPARSSFIVFL